MHRISDGPGFVRYAMGNKAVVTLHDGYIDRPLTRLRHGAGPIGPEVSARVALIDGELRLSVNAFLIEEDGARTLIDTGASNAWEPTMGNLLASLAAAGVARDEIDTVALTHSHLDHFGGLVAPDGTDAFPQLRRVLVPGLEIESFKKVKELLVSATMYRVRRWIYRETRHGCDPCRRA